jgi:hypothetical protein
MRALLIVALLSGVARADLVLAPSASPQYDLLLRRGADVVRAMKAHDFAQLARLADPGGVRFSPYAPGSARDVRLSPTEIAAATGVRHWGSAAGSGLPIKMSFKKYLERYVFDRDFTKVIPTLVGEGRLEYKVPAKKKGGMDWRTLKLEFVHNGSNWWLVSVVHDEWTI